MYKGAKLGSAPSACALVVFFVLSHPKAKFGAKISPKIFGIYVIYCLRMLITNVSALSQKLWLYLGVKCVRTRIVHCLS